MLRGNAIAALENVALWHERDISHSRVERIIFPDSCTLLDYMFGLLTRLVDGLMVYPENMKRNLGLSLGMWNSQTVLLALIKKGLTREAAYKLVPGAAMKTWKVKHAGRDDADFVEQLKAGPTVAKHFKPGELEKLCSLDFHFKEVNGKIPETWPLSMRDVLRLHRWSRSDDCNGLVIGDLGSEVFTTGGEPCGGTGHRDVQAFSESRKCPSVSRTTHVGIDKTFQVAFRPSTPDLRRRAVEDKNDGGIRLPN